LGGFALGRDGGVDILIASTASSKKWGEVMEIPFRRRHGVSERLKRVMRCGEAAQLTQRSRESEIRFSEM